MVVEEEKQISMGMIKHFWKDIMINQQIFGGPWGSLSDLEYFFLHYTSSIYSTASKKLCGIAGIERK
ncbi:MAG: hypothetical protein WAZ77_00695 [Candidatus Nitrosopolaris sp.]